MRLTIEKLAPLSTEPSWSVFEVKDGAIVSGSGAGPFTTEEQARAWCMAKQNECVICERQIPTNLCAIVRGGIGEEDGVACLGCAAEQGEITAGIA